MRYATPAAILLLAIAVVFMRPTAEAQPGKKGFPWTLKDAAKADVLKFVIENQAEALRAEVDFRSRRLAEMKRGVGAIKVPQSERQAKIKEQTAMIADLKAGKIIALPYLSLPKLEKGQAGQLTTPFEVKVVKIIDKSSAVVDLRYFPWSKFRILPDRPEMESHSEDPVVLPAIVSGVDTSAWVDDKVLTNELTEIAVIGPRRYREQTLTEIRPISRSDFKRSE